MFIFSRDTDAITRTYGLAGLKGVELADLQANIVTTLQCGCFVGALCTGFIADKIGRRYNLILAAVAAIIGTVMQAAASGEIACLFVGRFIAGLGVGAASMVTPLYSKLGRDTFCADCTDQHPSLRERSSCHPWWFDWNLPALHHCRNHAGFLDQLRLERTPQGRHAIRHSSHHARSSCCFALRIYVVLQRVTQMARTSRPLGRGLCCTLPRSQLACDSPLRCWRVD
jgi:hypothetical protein